VPAGEKYSQARFAGRAEEKKHYGCKENPQAGGLRYTG